MLTECQLRSMRRTIESTFDKTATILTQATSGDRRGGSNDNWGDAAEATAPCLVKSAKPPDSLVEEGRVTSLDYRLITLPHGTAITARNRLRVDGRTYEVLGVVDEESYATSVPCHCKRITP